MQETRQDARVDPLLDPLTALAHLEQLARRGQQSIREGRSLTGVSILKRIEMDAQDARRWAGSEIVSVPSRPHRTMGRR